MAGCIGDANYLFMSQSLCPSASKSLALTFEPGPSGSSCQISWKSFQPSFGAQPIAVPFSAPAPLLTVAEPPSAWASAIGARLTGPGDTATIDTTEARVDTPPPNTTTAAKTVAPPTSHRQTETAFVQETPESPSGWRSTKALVGMAVTSVVLIAVAITLTQLGNHFRRIANHNGNWTYNTQNYYWIGSALCIVCAAALIIAIVVLIRRKAAVLPQRLPPAK
jgi:hypothetical protein